MFPPVPSQRRYGHLSFLPNVTRSGFSLESRIPWRLANWVPSQQCERKGEGASSTESTFDSCSISITRNTLSSIFCRGRVKWDEAKLAEIEATKPIRQKIAEPKTPYHPMLGEDGSLSPAQYVVRSIGYAADAEVLRNALNKVVSSQKHYASLGGWTSSDDEADAMEQQEASIMVQRGMSFKDRGKEHSDEFWRVKVLKKKGCLLDNENDAGRGPLSSLLSFRVREIHIDGPEE